MTSTPTQMDVVFIWHMHQPDYRDHAQRKILLPWVRLHALKDYYDMPARLMKFDGIHQTFNLVPSLVEQIESYLSEGWREEELDLFMAPAEHLTESQKHFILANFFLAPEDQMIRPYPRYASLLRDHLLKSPAGLIYHWTAQEWRDLQFWRVLSWIDPMIREQDELIGSLLQRGQNYDESQKPLLLERMRHWLRESLEIYRRLQDQGLIEVSVSPFYHPILPLLIDPSTVQEALPDCPLPEPHGAHLEDARAHVEKSVRFYEKQFGRKPRGFWPSEGSVSDGVAALLGEFDVEWFASDEAILERSLGTPIRSAHGQTQANPILYRPYATLAGEGPTILFRDHRLSDLIGFQYASWDPKVAAQHLIGELVSIARNWKEAVPPLIPIILDGENCWEYYEKDGGPFLDCLYSLLQETPEIHCRTVSEAIEGRERIPLERLAPGSWINGNFYIWMGEEADRRAWAFLEETRRALVAAKREKAVPSQRIQEAWEELYVAQGSDWFWWFGESQQSRQDALFDEMFRLHLLRVYDLIGKPAPAILHTPIESERLEERVQCQPYLSAPPIIDGRETHFYEWRAAARFVPGRSGGAMQQSLKSAVSGVLYGVDEYRLYIRIDPSDSSRISINDWRYEIRVAAPRPQRIRFLLDNGTFQARKGLLKDTGIGIPIPDENGWEILAHANLEIAEGKVFEVALPWEILESTPGEVLSFFIGCPMGKGEIEMVPPLSSLCVTVPSKDRPGKHWFP